MFYLNYFFTHACAIVLLVWTIIFDYLNIFFAHFNYIFFGSIWTIFLWFKWAKRYLSAHRMLSYGAISFKRPISKRQGWTIILFYLRFYLKYLFAHVNYFWLSNYFFALWTIFFSFELSFFSFDWNIHSFELCFGSPPFCLHALHFGLRLLFLFFV